MGDSIRERWGLVIAGMAAAVMLLLAGLAGDAAAEGPRYSLSASPDTVSWPDAPDFRYRLEVSSGDEPLELDFEFPDPGWGHSRVSGALFDIDLARLEGPGKLDTTIGPIPAPKGVPFQGCVRGLPVWHSAATYRLNLDANQTTTVTADGRLAAAPLPDTPREIRVSLGTDRTEPAILTAPLNVGGSKGVLITSRFTGAGNRNSISRTVGRGFKLEGATTPVLPGKQISIRAMQLTGRGATPKLKTRLLTTVRTDRAGRFSTGNLRLDRPGAWTLEPTLSSPDPYDNAPGCGGMVNVAPAGKPVTPKRLTGRTFISTRVVGRSLGRSKVRLSFSRLKKQASSMPKGPFLSLSTGCNRMGGNYTVRANRLRLRPFVFSTEMLCRPDHDRWLLRLLRKGVKVKLNGKRLTLTRGKTRIVLRQAR